MNRKGVSQVLSLIIAASVLMMMALTLMVAFSGSMNDFTGGNDRNSCIQGIQKQCSTGAQNAAVPSACTNLENPETVVNGINGVSGYGSGDSTVSCSQG